MEVGSIIIFNGQIKLLEEARMFWKKRRNKSIEIEPKVCNPVFCTCGVILPYKDSLNEHRLMGHFDLPDYELSKEQKMKIVSIVKIHGSLYLGRSGIRTDKKTGYRMTGCEVYYFCNSGSTPTLFWDDDPNVSSAFAKAAKAYASKYQDKVAKVLQTMVLE